MKTTYGKEISNSITAEYLVFLVDKVFALLPMFEEAMKSESAFNSFEIYQYSLIETINGNTKLLEYEDIRIIDVLSRLQALLALKPSEENHSRYKRHILKICKLLNQIKDGVENGL